MGREHEPQLGHPPPEARDYPKEVKNPGGITIATVEGKKTPEELEAERRAEELRQQKELQLRADRALLAGYTQETRAIDKWLVRRAAAIGLVGATGVERLDARERGIDATARPD